MVFSSIPFVNYFLPLVILVYFISPRKLKNAVLLISSLLFYGWGEQRFIVFMLISIAQGYVFGILIEKYRKNIKLSRLFAFISAAISVGLLIYCKYADFFISNFNAVTGLSIPLLNIVLPIGISFYTFQILSYTIDVKRGNVKAQKNPINLGAYIALFPQLIAGPIVRYSDICSQLENREHNLAKAAIGARRFVIGLAKKVLIANQLGELISVYKDSSDKSVLFVWLYVIAYCIHIYFDFSGYSDMAIGLGKIFGFDFPENFNYPYISKSATEFWRRWHMTLGSWFRDYVYIPMGGNRVSKPRWLFNILTVWALTGFWHGASWVYIVWGLFFALLLMAEKLWYLKYLEKSKILCRLYAMLFISVSFALFDSASIGSSVTTIGSMFGLGSLPVVSAEAVYYLRSYAVIIAIGAFGSLPFAKNIALKLSASKYGEKILTVIEPLLLLVLLALSTAYLVDGSYNPFLYFRF